MELWPKRAIKLEVTMPPGSKEEPRVAVHLYADDDYSPFLQAFAIPLGRVEVVVNEEHGSPRCTQMWTLEALMALAVDRTRQRG